MLLISFSAVPSCERINAMKSPNTIVDSTNPQQTEYLSDGNQGDDGKSWTAVGNSPAVKVKLDNSTEVMAVEMAEVTGSEVANVILENNGVKVAQAEVDTREGVSILDILRSIDFLCVVRTFTRRA